MDKIKEQFTMALLIKMLKGYYSPLRALSYGKHLILSVGSRSIGKSTGIALLFIYMFVHDGKEWIYSRRTKDETAITAASYFDNAVSLLQENGVDIAAVIMEKSKYYIVPKHDEKEEGQKILAGYVVPLSTSQKEKSQALYVRVCNLMYDEFIADTPSGYLGTKDDPYAEYRKLWNLYATIDRAPGRPYRDELIIWCAGNMQPYALARNPIIQSLKIYRYIKTDTKIVAPKNEEWYYEQTDNVDATIGYENHVSYKLASADIRRSMFNNEVLQNSEYLVQKMKAPGAPICNLSLYGHHVGVWQMKNDGIIYISNKKTQLQTYALTVGDFNDINFMLDLKGVYTPAIELIREMYFHNLIRFETNQIKSDIENYFMLA